MLSTLLICLLILYIPSASGQQALTWGWTLLGVGGVCIICHGRAGAKAIHNAITTAALFVEKNMTGLISERIAEVQKRR